MSLTLNMLKEELSLCFTHSVANSCGCTLEKIGRDIDSVDCNLRYPGLTLPAAINHFPEINIQLKATSSPNYKDDVIRYSLPIKNYNELRCQSYSCRLLVLIVIPKVKNYLFKRQPKGIIIFGKAYWANLKGMPESGNKKEIKISIPTRNAFTPKILFKMMHNLSNDLEVDYGL